MCNVKRLYGICNKLCTVLELRGGGVQKDRTPLLFFFFAHPNYFFTGARGQGVENTTEIIFLQM